MYDEIAQKSAYRVQVSEKKSRDIFVNQYTLNALCSYHAWEEIHILLAPGRILPVKEVRPIQVAATATLRTAAASSSNTTLVLGSRLCTTVHTTKKIMLL